MLTKEESVATLKRLREETGIAIMICKRALDDCNYDYDKAKTLVIKYAREIMYI